MTYCNTKSIKFQKVRKSNKCCHCWLKSCCWTTSTNFLNREIWKKRVLKKISHYQHFMLKNLSFEQWCRLMYCTNYKTFLVKNVIMNTLIMLHCEMNWIKNVNTFKHMDRRAQHIQWFHCFNPQSIHVFLPHTVGKFCFLVIWFISINYCQDWSWLTVINPQLPWD